MSTAAFSRSSCFTRPSRPGLAVPHKTIRRTSRATILRVHASAEYETLKGLTVYKSTNGEPVELTELWQPAPGTKVVIPFLTHFADLSSWEYAQKLVRVLPTLEASGVQVFAVGLGSVANSQEFCRILKFPQEKLFADPDATCYRALNFNPGFADNVDISPYAKLLPMLMGIGSPGTVEEVLRGYVGDKDSKPVFDSPTPFDILGAGYQRPFELATLRLFNMVGILPKWGELSPPNTTLLTQQGGTVAFNGTDVIFRHNDTGILKYADVDALLRGVLSADYTVQSQSVTTIN